jgi:hypothetical protein
VAARRILITASFVIFTNFIIVLSSYFEFIPQIYFLGFRFNLFLLLNVILIFAYYKKFTIEQLAPFKRFGKFKHWFAAFSIPVLLAGFVICVVYLFGEVKISKQKYFYEFGMTSLLDFPMYFVWTLPFIFSTLYLLFNVLNTNRYFSSIIKSILIAVSTSGFYLYYFDEDRIIAYIVYFLLVSSIMLFNYAFFMWCRSIWVASFSIFMAIFSFVLVFGSSNEFLIKTFFARNYEKWEGFFNLKLIENVPAESGLFPLLIILSIVFFNLDKESDIKKR